MAAKTAHQHHIGRFQARAEEDGALRLWMPTHSQLRAVKTVTIGPKGRVHMPGYRAEKCVRDGLK